MNLRTRITIVASVAAVVATTVLPALSGAAPIDDKRRQAAELARQIDANDHQIVSLSEQLNGLTIKREQTRAAIEAAQERTDAAIAERARIRKTLAKRAVQLYQGGSTSTPLEQIDVGSVGEIAAREKYSAAAADRDDVLVARLQKTEEDLAARKADLERQKASLEAQQAAAESTRSRLESANSRNRALASEVQGEIAQLVDQERRAREAEARRTAAATAARTSTRTATGGGGGGGGSRSAPIPPNFPDAPAPNGGAAAAVAFAKAQVGKGYRYATSGPDTFDCSGLTAAAWAQGGVSLAHYSGAQYQQTIRIGAGDLQPGDLVFYGPGGANHVEIYIGGGMVVSASNPSSGVKLTSVRYGSASGYGRVRG